MDYSCRAEPVFQIALEVILQIAIQILVIIVIQIVILAMEIYKLNVYLVLLVKHYIRANVYLLAQVITIPVTIFVINAIQLVKNVVAL